MTFGEVVNASCGAAVGGSYFLWGIYKKEKVQLVFDLFGGLYSIEINWEILIPDQRMIYS